MEEQLCVTICHSLQLHRSLCLYDSFAFDLRTDLVLKMLRIFYVLVIRIRRCTEDLFGRGCDAV